MRRLFVSCILFLVIAPVYPVAAQQQANLDLRRAVPMDAYLAVYGRHNPERDFQREYFKEVWNTVEETKIIPRIIEIVTSQIPEDELEEAKSVFEQIREAAEPIDWEALGDAEEIVYAQKMAVPTAQHLLLFRMTPEAAASYEEGVTNLLKLIEQMSDGRVPIVVDNQDSAKITTMALPAEVPFRPCVARIDDVFIFSSSDQLVRQCLKSLTSKSGESKFDDPRLKEALSQLPKPEDSIVFYDGRTQFRQLRDLGQFIRQQGGGNSEAERIAGLMETLFDELSILDYIVTVEYTEGNHNCSDSLGKLMPDAEDKVLMKAVGSGRAFEDWTKWVPENALSYSLNTGINLEPIYDWVIATVEKEFPEAREGLEQFEAIQSNLDVHLKQDILQAFSGEGVSVTLPSAKPSMLATSDSVMAMRCQKPDRIRELLHRAVDKLGEIPAVKAQKLEMAPCEALDGFETLSATVLTPFGITPVIGFHDGWMVVGSNAEAVQAVFATRSGDAKSIADTEAFQQFGIKVEGPVDAIAYRNLAEGTRGAAKFIGQIGAFAPMIIGLAGAEADPEDLKPVQDILSLLPDVAKIITKFDFYEAQLSLTQDGPQSGTFVQKRVVLVRPAPTE